MPGRLPGNSAFFRLAGRFLQNDWAARSSEEMERGRTVELSPLRGAGTMRRLFCALALLGLAGWADTPARADGFLIPRDHSLPPLALVYQRVNVTIEGQVATTSVEQDFRNSTPQDLEADYLFPLPPGASVREF